MVPGEPPLTQHRQDQGAGGGFQETEQRTHTHLHRQDTCGAGKQSFTSPRISHGLLTQTQCWRRHISASSSWDGWGSLEWAPASSDPSTPALWRASWPAASPPGLETAPLATAKLCKGSCELPATLLEVSFPPSRTSTPGVYKESQEDHQGLQPSIPQTALSAALRETSPQHPIPH